MENIIDRSTATRDQSSNKFMLAQRIFRQWQRTKLQILVWYCNTSNTRPFPTEHGKKTFTKRTFIHLTQSNRWYDFNFLNYVRITVWRSILISHYYSRYCNNIIGVSVSTGYYSFIFNNVRHRFSKRCFSTLTSSLQPMNDGSLVLPAILSILKWLVLQQ